MPKSKTEHETPFGITAMPPLFIAFILLIVLVPLPFGSNRPWSSDLFAVLSGFLLAGSLWVFNGTSILPNQAPRKRLTFSAISLTLVVIWSYIQTAPWTPDSWHHPLWQEAATTLGPVRGAISVDPGLFPESIIRLTGYVACFLIAFLWGRDHQKALVLIKALAIAGAAYAFYGLIAQSMGSTTILWYEKWAYKGFLTSTFVNKNSYAAYAGLGLLCSLAYLNHHFNHFRILDPVLAQQSKASAFFTSLSLRDYAILLIPIVILAALVLTGSRAGLVSTLVGVIGFALAMTIHRHWSAKRWAYGAGACLVFLIIFIALGGGTLLSRLGQAKLDEDTAMRLSGYELSLQAISDNPWLGFGLGTFNSAFRLYRDSTLPIWFHHAHNDYIEMIMDLGIPAAFLLFFALLSVASCCITGLWQRRRRGIYPALAIGASALLYTHAFVDFSWHIPAIAATYAALLGLGAAQSWSTREEKR